MQRKTRIKIWTAFVVTAFVTSCNGSGEQCEGACAAEPSSQSTGLGPQALTPTGIGITALNVLDFGAKGDEVTDDTKALQAAFDACYNTGALPRGSFTPSEVYLPPGLYRISASLQLRTGVNLVGAGTMRTMNINESPWGGSTIMLSRDVNVPAIVVENAAHGLSVRQLRITQELGSTADISSAHGIHVRGTTELSGFGELSMIDRVAVYSMGGDGIAFIRENYGHMRAISIKGDGNTGSLIAIRNVSRQSSFFFETVGIESGPAGSGHLDQGIVLEDAGFASVLIAQLDVRVTSN